MSNIWLLGFVIPGLFAFIATSTPKDYMCPVCHEHARIAFNGYGVCDECGWLEDLE